MLKVSRRSALFTTAGLTLLPFRAMAAPVTYRLAGLADYSGPFADVMKPLIEGRDGILKWWSAEVGSNLGVSVQAKNYDTRYDAAQVASLWPGIRAELNPVVSLGIGSVDATALADRYAEAKIVSVQSGATATNSWVPDSWVFYYRATYAHEVASFFDWIYEKEGRKAPIKVAVISSEAAPAFVDMAKGVQAAAAQLGKIQIAELIWDSAQPIDLTTQVRRIVAAGAECIVIQTNTAAVVAAKRALQALNAKIPIVTTSHNGMLASGKAVGGLSQMEGDFEVHSMVMPTDDAPQKKLYDTLKAKYGLTQPWGGLVVQGMSQGVIAVRAIEAGVRKFGPADLSGEKIRAAMLSSSLPGQDGMLPTLTFDSSAPFPTSGLTTNVATIKGGAYMVIARDLPVPALKKW
jgi:branched-chain amino acid transport system substrate-binding protein